VNAETFQQREVVHQVIEIRGEQRLAAEIDHEGFIPVRVDVGRGISEPVDEGLICYHQKRGFIENMSFCSLGYDYKA
jgi:hypothetical protein